MVTYTSDRFEEFKEYALVMIKSGDAYMDDTPQVRNASLNQRFISLSLLSSGSVFLFLMLLAFSLSLLFPIYRYSTSKLYS